MTNKYYETENLYFDDYKNLNLCTIIDDVIKLKKNICTIENNNIENKNIVNRSNIIDTDNTISKNKIINIDNIIDYNKLLEIKTIYNPNCKKKLYKEKNMYSNEFNLCNCINNNNVFKNIKWC